MPASVYGRLHSTDLQHDAAYAHALVMGMDEWDKYEWWRIYEDFTSWLKRRAAELMREWGYENEN